MHTLKIEVDGTIHSLSGHQELTFGRDSSCTVRLDATDLGVSRIAGRIAADDGFWWITNLSSKRALHIADGNGFTVPLPVARPGWPLSRRAVDQDRLTVLVPGERWTYALTLHADPRPNGAPTSPAPADPYSTRIPVLRLTDARREVLVALVSGYLRPHPHYDPRPCGYDQIAALLGLTRSQVTRRVEDVRDLLTTAGVEGLGGERDSRRALCEWLLAARLVTPADLEWLQQRIESARRNTAAANPTGRQASAGQAQAPVRPVTAPPGGPSTNAFARLPRNRIINAAQTAAAALAPVLAARLGQVYGPGWLQAVNTNRRRKGLPPGHSLDDERFCLAVLARDDATQEWADEGIRSAAAALKTLADQAVHGRPLPPDAVARAKAWAERLTEWVQRL
ncbi:hypothetical protein GCM10027168_26260 [Streptomyces capparidis]